MEIMYYVFYVSQSLVFLLLRSYDKTEMKTTKYASKSDRHNELFDEVMEHLNKRTRELLPPNMKQVLSHLILADCSHHSFISKPELAYRVMNLPVVDKSFDAVDVVGFYKRANIRVVADEQNTIEYSDRTEYSAYAERCRPDTEFSGKLTRSDVENMTFNEFASSVRDTRSKNADFQSVEIGQATKFRSRDVASGHWILSKRQARRHIRPSSFVHSSDNRLRTGGTW